jgi:transposase-like protein
MEDRIAKLKTRVRALHKGRVASQARYPEDLREEIAVVTRTVQAVGRSVYSLAREIGVSAPTLIEWARQPTRRPWRPVTVTAPPAAPEAAPQVSPVLVTPHGVRVEGLDVASIVTVLRSLA